MSRPDPGAAPDRRDPSGAMIDAMQDGLVATGPDGAVVRVSPSFCVMTGFSEEELLGSQAPFPFWPEGSMDEIARATARSRQGGVREFDLTFRRKDGSHFPVIVSAAPIDGGPGGVAVVKDATRRRANEEAIAQALDDLARAQRIAGLGSYVFDVVNERIIWSDQLFRIFGLPPTPDHAVSVDLLLSMVHPDDRAVLQDAIRGTQVEGGVTPVVEHRIVRPDGSIRVVAVEQGELVMDAQGHPVRLVGTVLDITYRRAAEEQIARLAEQRGRLVADALEAEDRARQRIAEALHDDVLQDLLAARQDLAEAAGDSPPAALGRAREGLARATAMLREAVAELHPVTLSHGGLPAATRAVAERAARRGGFEVELRVDASVAGPLDRLVLGLVRELLENAAKHADASRVIVRILREEGDVVVSVEDDGRGIAPGRLEEALAEGHIGLAAARERVRALDGSLGAGPGALGGALVVARIPGQANAG